MKKNKAIPSTLEDVALVNQRQTRVFLLSTRIEVNSRHSFISAKRTFSSGFSLWRYL